MYRKITNIEFTVVCLKLKINLKKQNTFRLGFIMDNKTIKIYGKYQKFLKIF